MLKILIVDDTRSVHAFIKGLFSRLSGITHHDVFDGKQALEHLNTGAKYDLILLDWEMPNMDGPTTFEEFKKIDVGCPVIMMTTKNNPQDIERMILAGVSEYMMKPFTLDILVEKIESVTGTSVPHAA